MIFELAGAEDFLAVNRLARQVCEHHAQWDKSIQLIDEPYPMDWYMECIDGSSLFSNVIYVAREGDMVVGFVRFYLWETNSTVSGKQKMLTIDDIGVDISFRNRGIVNWQRAGIVPVYAFMWMPKTKALISITSNAVSMSVISVWDSHYKRRWLRFSVIFVEAFYDPYFQQKRTTDHLEPAGSGSDPGYSGFQPY